jgi:hypothetical protein
VAGFGRLDLGPGCSIRLRRSGPASRSNRASHTRSPKSQVFVSKPLFGIGFFPWTERLVVGGHFSVFGSIFPLACRKWTAAVLTWDVSIFHRIRLSTGDLVQCRTIWTPEKPRTKIGHNGGTPEAPTRNQFRARATNGFEDLPDDLQSRFQISKPQPPRTLCRSERYRAGPGAPMRRVQ